MQICKYVDMQICKYAVCGTPERSAASGFDLVRRASRLPADEHDLAGCHHHHHHHLYHLHPIIIDYQGLEVCRIGLLFPLYSGSYIICPWAKFSQVHSIHCHYHHRSLRGHHGDHGLGEGLKNDPQVLRKPFIKFICNSASYFFFLCE